MSYRTKSADGVVENSDLENLRLVRKYKRWSLENLTRLGTKYHSPFGLNQTFSIVPRTLPGVMLLFHHAILQWTGLLPTHLHYRRRDL